MLTIIEILSVLGTVVYIYLAAKKKAVAWIFGTIASVLAAYLFYARGLYGSSLLNVVYALQGIIGYINWKKYISEKMPAYELKWVYHLLWIFACVLLSYLLHLLFAFLFTGPVLYLDILLAVFSILATSLEIRKDTSCWWYWICCNLAYSGLYLWQSLRMGESLFVYAALMAGLAIFSYFGLKAWSRQNKGPRRNNRVPV